MRSTYPACGPPISWTKRRQNADSADYCALAARQHCDGDPFLPDVDDDDHNDDDGDVVGIDGCCGADSKTTSFSPTLTGLMAKVTVDDEMARTTYCCYHQRAHQQRQLADRPLGISVGALQWPVNL